MKTFFVISTIFAASLAHPHGSEHFTVGPKSLAPQGKMPVIGYGTWNAKDSSLETALEEALNAGYKHIDTATVYENEEVIGKILQKWLTSGKLKREDLFITTKLPPYGNRPEGVKKYLEKSLKNLQLDYVDLYLIHTPFGFVDLKEGEKDDREKRGIDPSTDLIGIWKAMEEQVEAGKTKAIGVSNFNISQIQKILDHSKIKPAVLQVEVHVYHQQVPLVEFSQKNNIVVTAYSPLGSPGLGRTVTNPKTKEVLPNILQNPVVKEIAKKHAVSEAQVVLRQGIQRGLIVIPKSTNAERLKKNLDVFSFQLDKDDLSKLKALDLGEDGKILDFKTFQGVTDHPEFPFSHVL